MDDRDRPAVRSYNRTMLLIALLLALTAAACSAPAPTAAEPANVVIFSIDTLRPDHLGVYGYPRATSPHIDAFAATAVVFDQAVTVHVTTAPAHATVLTGRYPRSHGITRNGMRLDDDVPTLAEVLAANGFATGAFISGWTLERHTGLDRGFEVYDDDLGPPRAGARRDGRRTAERAIAWLDEQIEDDRRFFLFVHVFEPHWPYAPPPADALRFLPGQRRLATLARPEHIDRRSSINRLSEAEKREYIARYDGEIAVADRLLDQLLVALDTLGATDNTVVILLSDHGETLFERDWVMDHGARPYDEQARVPLILRLPGGRLAGRRVAEQVSLVDVAPTVLEIFGIDTPGGVQGRSLLPLARGIGGDPRPALITARPEPSRVPHIDGPLSKSGLVRAIRLPGRKLIEYPRSADRWHTELFNLDADPDERVDASGARSAEVEELHRSLDRLFHASGESEPTSSPELEPAVADALRELGYIDD